MVAKKQDQSVPVSKGLYRSTANKVIAGVCGGLGEYFDLDPVILRIIFILAAIFGGSGLLIYLVLWLLVPEEKNNLSFEENVRKNVESMKSGAQTFAQDLRLGRRGDSNSRFWWGTFIIIFGFYFLLNNLGLISDIDLGRFWPLVLIFLGLFVLVRK